ncbi:MAG: CDP-alcohol phosphatidyltransferase family protein [Microthrixaceae bacterium]|nr:CDP-alcohol phosphatidyltransferase family protein [Microthrixaceae bacterium]
MDQLDHGIGSDTGTGDGARTGSESHEAKRRRGLAGEEIPAGEDRLATVPNLVTLIRFLCIPLFVWLLFGKDDHFSAAVLLGVLGATDWVDGYVARHFNQVSNFGKMFDPTVDRLLMVVGIGSTILADLDIRYFMVFAPIVIIREVTLSIFVAATVLLGAKRMDVTWIGKCGTFLMMVAFPAFLASSDSRFVGTATQTGFLALAWTAAIPGLVCSLIAYFGYFPTGLAALREGRAAHEAEVLADSEGHGSVS